MLSPACLAQGGILEAVLLHDHDSSSGYSALLGQNEH
jgi:hypothetical protein